MGIVIELKEAVLDVRPGLGDPYSQRLRHQALVVLNYIERCENFVVNPQEKVYNGISLGDMALIKGEL